jgi:hypothetical protein
MGDWRLHVTYSNGETRVQEHDDKKSLLCAFWEVANGQESQGGKVEKIEARDHFAFSRDPLLIIGEKGPTGRVNQFTI